MAVNPRKSVIANIVQSGQSPHACDHPTPIPQGLYKHHQTASSWWEENWTINVFTDTQLKKRIPKSVYKIYRACVKDHKGLDDIVADVIANAMKEWASERGATHYTHWFQPIHMHSAEKHDSFLSFMGDGKALLEFRGADLIRGEPDASSFPNGGIRTTYEARGYTAWDASSPVFLRESPNGTTLIIPCMFCSWTGEALDMKTPLLRSIDALSTQATRLLRLLGDEKVQSVHSTLGPEQEFFILDRNFYLSRPDLVLSGRTVFGAKPAKGQELEDHYLARINPRVLAFIQDVEQEMWRLGIPTKTRHNEVAPGQHEMAPIFEDSNVACDHNMLLMELLKEIAIKHNLTVLLHEKPFAGVNGSGKHNNWSMCTDYGLNLLEPSESPETNIIFQVFLAACIKAVDVHADLLRISITSPGNDFRLGANEAPPAIMSAYLGSEIGELVYKLTATKGKEFVRMPSFVNLALNVAPFKRDRTDRNRTSPFAFTGNKFEFRAVGSSQNIGGTCMTLNVILADAIRSMADTLEKLLLNSPKDIAIKAIISETLKEHQRIIYDGNGYSQEWVEEAAKRGLPNFKENVSAMEQLVSAKNIALFQSLGVLSPNELESRKNILFEHYAKTINVEGEVATMMAATYVLPSAIKFQHILADSIKSARDILTGEDFSSQVDLLKQLTSHINGLINSNKKLISVLKASKHHHHNVVELAKYYRDVVKAALEETRTHADALELLVADEDWPIPKYYDMLFLK